MNNSITSKFGDTSIQSIKGIYTKLELLYKNLITCMFLRQTQHLRFWYPLERFKL